VAVRNARVGKLQSKVNRILITLTQWVLWTTIGVLFGALTERDLASSVTTRY
jgi:hypothetical protein